MLPSSQGSIPPAGLLAHRRGTGTVNINMLLRNARYPVRQCGQPLHLPLKKKSPGYLDTAHQRDYFRLWISCVSEIPDFETFQSFRHENLLGTGARTVRGWKDIRQLASTCSD